MLSRFPTWSVRKPDTTRADAVCKVGGAPIGWPRDWPVCAMCSLPMSFLGQFTGDPLAPRLPAGHTLFLFTCERDSICDFWDPVAGANACVLIPHDELGAHPTSIPGDTPVLLELWVSKWTSRDDGIPAELEESLHENGRFHDLPEDVVFPHDFDSALLTKAGGAPYWTANGPCDLLDPSDRLVLQLDSWLTVSEGQGALAAHAENFPGTVELDDDAASIANFCLDGIGFVMTHAGEPEIYFMINR